MKQKPRLTIFYDGRCPLCVAEMTRLQKLDKHHRIALVNLQEDNLTQLYPELNQARAMNILQGRLDNGRYIEGLDVTHKAWSLVGRGHWTFILRLPFLKWVFNFIYLLFARHRYRISGWLTGQSKVNCTVCSLPPEPSSQPISPSESDRT